MACADSTVQSSLPTDAVLPTGALAVLVPCPVPPTALEMCSCLHSGSLEVLSLTPPPLAGSIPLLEEADEDDLVVAEIAAVVLESVADIIGE